MLEQIAELQRTAGPCSTLAEALRERPNESYAVRVVRQVASELATGRNPAFSRYAGQGPLLSRYAGQGVSPPVSRSALAAGAALRAQLLECEAIAEQQHAANARLLAAVEAWLSAVGP